MNDTTETRWIGITEQALALGIRSIVQISEKAWDEAIELWGDPTPGMEDEDERIRRLLVAVRERANGAHGTEPLHIAVQDPTGGAPIPLVLRKWENQRGPTRITINSRND